MTEDTTARVINVLFSQIEIMKSDTSPSFAEALAALTVRSYMTQGDTEKPGMLRVSINESGRFDIVDFTTPSRDGRLLYTNAQQEDIPHWVIEAISLLRITEERSVVQSIGFKVHDKLYYIIDKRDDYETN